MKNIIRCANCCTEITWKNTATNTEYCYECYERIRNLDKIVEEIKKDNNILNISEDITSEQK